MAGASSATLERLWHDTRKRPLRVSSTACSIWRFCSTRAKPPRLIPKRAAHLLLSSAQLGHPWSKTMLGGPLLIFAPATRTEIKRSDSTRANHVGH